MGTIGRSTFQTSIVNHSLYFIFVFREMAEQVLGVLVSWYGRKTWTVEEMKILESLNKTLPHEECEQECVAKEIESTGLVEELAKLDPSTLTAALSNPGQHQQTFDPVLDKVVGSALAVTDACRPTTTACFKCIKVCHLFFIFTHSSFQSSWKMNTIIFVHIPKSIWKVSLQTKLYFQACINGGGGGKAAAASLTIFFPLTLTFLMF